MNKFQLGKYYTCLLQLMNIDLYYNPNIQMHLEKNKFLVDI